MMKHLDLLAFILMVVGGINWGLVGLCNYNLVTAIAGDGTTATKVVYALVGLCALYEAFKAMRSKDAATSS
jgi:uncharacterized membrane protein YuzA (DUF378 family)